MQLHSIKPSNTFVLSAICLCHIILVHLCTQVCFVPAGAYGNGYKKVCSKKENSSNKTWKESCAKAEKGCAKSEKSSTKEEKENYTAFTQAWFAWFNKTTT